MRIHNTFDGAQLEKLERLYADYPVTPHDFPEVPLAVYTGGKLSGKATALYSLIIQMDWKKVIEGDCETTGLFCSVSYRKQEDWRKVLLLREFNTKTQETRHYINYWPKGLLAVRTTDWLEVLENNA